jgi:hypothetical protein
MTITNGYTTTSQVKASDILSISATDTASDALLEILIEAASRVIDADTGRYFYKSATDETKYYSAEFADRLFLFDDIVTITTLATDADDSRTYADVWSASTDYDLKPYNNAAKGLPFTSIEVRPGSAYSFPYYSKGIKIVGIFGYPSVPMAIQTACILLTARTFKRMSTPLGVASMAALGEVQIAIKDKEPDYWHLIREFMRKV